MGYSHETDPARSRFVDCYWEAGLPEGRDSITYPSLPEPYVNLFFALQEGVPARVKGLSERTDLLEMSTPLFGVRLQPRAWIYLGAGPWSRISNRVVCVADVGHEPLTDVARRLSRCASFSERVHTFQAFWDACVSDPAVAAQTNPSQLMQTAAAVDHVVAAFRRPDVVRVFAESHGVSPRTVSRWFARDVGLSPKVLARIARFHAALGSLHSEKAPAFFLDCGYFDQAHFIREFKAFTGFPPETYLAMLPG